MSNAPITNTCAAKAAVPFMHTPRPAIVNPHSTEFSRSYGANPTTARLGQDTAHHDGTVCVQSNPDTFPGIAALDVELSGDVSVARINTFLDVAGLRELARCLIDAAADIEADAAYPGGAA